MLSACSGISGGQTGRGRDHLNPVDRPFSAVTIRSVIAKSVGLLQRWCIRLNGRDPNWPRLFGEQLEEIVQACSPAEFESRMYAVIGLSPGAFFRQSAQLAPARYTISVASARSWVLRGRGIVSEFRIVSQPKRSRRTRRTRTRRR